MNGKRKKSDIETGGYLIIAGSSSESRCKSPLQSHNIRWESVVDPGGHLTCASIVLGFLQN